MGIDVEKLEIRGLTRGEVKALRKDGISLGELMDKDEAARDEAFDRILAIACPDVDPDAITPGQAVRIYEIIAEKTYLTGDEAKNSDSLQS